MDSGEGNIRLLIADDHALVRDLVGAHLQAQGGFQVDGVGTLSDALERIFMRGPYDLVLLDYVLPDSAGLADSMRLIEISEGNPVVLFSGLARPETVNEALDLGFSGFIPKSTSAIALADAIRRVRAGEIWLPEGYGATPLPGLLQRLTPREMEVLQAIREGLMNKEIAGRMRLSEVTIKMHVRSVCGKLRARNRTQAALIASELMP